MTEFNCQNCKKRRKFTMKEHNKMECETCNNSFKQCTIKNCSNIVRHGYICKECIGKGIKNGGSAALTVSLLAGSVAFKVLRKGK